jgi:hypothetical protein
MSKHILSVLIFYTLLFLIDYYGIIDLYGQNVVRRFINMYRRLDPLNYKKQLNPFCVRYKKILNKNDVALLQTIKIPKNTDISYFTRKNTITHQCCENYDKNEEQIMNNVSEKLRQSYEKQIGKKLYYMGNNKPTIYRYNGKITTFMAC